MKNLREKPRERCAGPTAQSHNSCRFAFFLPPYCRAFCIICSTVHRCISPHQVVLETVVKMSEAFRKTQPKGIWLYAGTTHWLFSMQNKMQRKPIWDALATFLLTTQLCFCQISHFWIRGEQIIQYSYLGPNSNNRIHTQKIFSNQILFVFTVGRFSKPNTFRIRTMSHAQLPFVFVFRGSLKTKL